MEPHPGSMRPTQDIWIYHSRFGSNQGVSRAHRMLLGLTNTGKANHSLLPRRSS